MYVRTGKLCMIAAGVILFSGLAIGTTNVTAKKGSVETKTQDRKTIDKKIKELKEQKRTEEKKLQNAKKQIDKLNKE